MLSPLFVYGTLLAGQANHGMLAGARGGVAAATLPRYTLLDVGDWPGLVAYGHDRVVGQLWHVDAALLARLDAFENCPAVYCRAPVALACGTPAEAYLLQPAHAAGLLPLRPANWPTHAARRRGALPVEP